MVFPPAYLALVGDYINSAKTPQIKGQFMKKMDVLHEITKKVPYRKAVRLNAVLNTNKLANERKEWRELILLPSKNEPWRNNLWLFRVGVANKSFSLTHKKEWRPPGHARIAAVIQEIETHFGRSLPRRNDCPYFLDPMGMPSEWCWGMAWALLEDRLQRMEDWCNRKHPTIDTIETIFLECIWLILCDEFGDLFGLPSTIWIRHPLRFALATILHDKQMRTGWKVPKPSSIKDHDDTLNNIIIESAFTNYAKSNIPNSRYQELVDDIVSIQIPAKYFQRSDREGTRATVTDQRIEEEFPEEINEEDGQSDAEDMFDGEAFNADSESGESSPFRLS